MTNKEWIVYPKNTLEIALTGNFGHVEFAFNRSDYRINVIADAANVIRADVYKRGAEMAWADLPNGVKKLAQTAVKLLVGNLVQKDN